MFKLIELLALLDMLPSYTANTTDHPHGLLTLNTPTTVAIAERAACSCDRFLMLSPPSNCTALSKKPKLAFKKSRNLRIATVWQSTCPLLGNRAAFPKNKQLNPRAWTEDPTQDAQAETCDGDLTQATAGAKVASATAAPSSLKALRAASATMSSCFSRSKPSSAEVLPRAVGSRTSCFTAPSAATAPP